VSTTPVPALVAEAYARWVHPAESVMVVPPASRKCMTNNSPSTMFAGMEMSRVMDPPTLHVAGVLCICWQATVGPFYATSTYSNDERSNTDKERPPD
jgi:hypothetical protein